VVVQGGERHRVPLSLVAPHLARALVRLEAVKAGRLTCARGQRCPRWGCCPLRGAQDWAMTVVAGASGIRIDCDRCGEHVGSPDLTLEPLRQATGFVRIDGADYCQRCGGIAPRSPAVDSVTTSREVLTASGFWSGGRERRSRGRLRSLARRGSVLAWTVRRSYRWQPERSATSTTARLPARDADGPAPGRLKRLRPSEPTRWPRGPLPLVDPRRAFSVDCGRPAGV
jgi:hypothetical protein